MPHLRPLALLGPFAFALTTAYAADLSSYSVVKLHAGLNSPDFAFAQRQVLVVIGHRDNFNAHSFEVVTFYLSNGDPSKSLNIVGIWDKDKEALTTSVSGGADCFLHDFRLLKSKSGDAPVLVVADRPLLGSFGENAPVTFRIYLLKHSTDGIPGEPPYRFDLVETRTSKAAYCDVGFALSRELGLDDYRTPPRPDDYWNYPGAMSNNRWRGP